MISSVKANILGVPIAEELYDENAHEFIKKNVAQMFDLHL